MFDLVPPRHFGEFAQGFRGDAMRTFDRMAREVRRRTGRWPRGARIEWVRIGRREYVTGMVLK